jgi:hypothetical protein
MLGALTLTRLAFAYDPPLTRRPQPRRGADRPPR